MKTTHGLSHIPEFRVWTAMKYRCNNPRCPCYNRYGGRGIKVCDQWAHSFENFLADMGRRPDAKHSLERKDNGLDYSPNNCIWAVAETQTNNRRNNVRLPFRGQSKTIAQWARTLGIEDGTIRARLFRWRWSIDDALSAPVKPWGTQRKENKK